ncbi:N-acetylhexosaminidase [Flagelloscypha sp. PMI_526]|nr:N-acetylhexosaminidase [Flagelloscypha sp. PMI_526]
MRSPLPAVALLATAVSTVSGLWPLPVPLVGSDSLPSATVKLSPGFSIKAPKGAGRDLSDAITRSQGYIKKDKLPALTPGAGSEYADKVSSAPLLTKLTLSLTGNGTKSIAEEAVKPFRQRSEGYTLVVPAGGGEATLTADSALGLFRGLTTFEQLWYDLSGVTYTVEAGLNIQDAPKYPYRGLMLDTARNYFTVDDIKRTIDAMSWTKLNNFHWHIVDAQSFPLVIPGFEDLSQKGAYFPGQVYNAKDVADVISYAAARGISVMPEIDTPGHTSVISKAHPEFIACPEKTPWASYSAEPPAGQIRIADSAAVSWTQNLFKATAKLFKTGPFLSIGGDEVNAKCYQEDSETQASLSASGKTIDQALSDFVLGNAKVVTDVGKTAVVWEEMVLDHNIALPQNGTAVLSWISSANAKSIAAKGYDIIHAPSDYFYLDCGHGAWVGAFPGGQSWCSFNSWQHAYSFDPLSNLTSEAEQKLVLGGQALLWAEQSNRYSLDNTLWPRAASIGEVFWSAGKDISAALSRLHAFSYRLQKRGIGSIALQPHWCAVRPGACDLTA